MRDRGWRWGPGGWALAALAGAVIAGLIGWGVAWTSGPMGGAGYGYGGMMPWGWGAMGAAMPLMVFAMLLFWLAVILGVVALVRWAVGAAGRREADHETDALEIARRRYARGELTREEYERLRDDLMRRPDRVA